MNMIFRLVLTIIALTLSGGRSDAAEMWTRLCNGSLTATLPSENANVDEPNVIVEGGLIKMWYDAGGTISAVHYATAPIPAPGVCPAAVATGGVRHLGVGGMVKIKKRRSS